VLAAKGQFQNAYPELMRLGEYRITEVLDARDGTCTIRVEVPGVRGLLHSTHAHSRELLREPPAQAGCD